MGILRAADGQFLGVPQTPTQKPGIPNPWAPKPAFLCVWDGKKVRADPIKNFSDPFFRLGDPRACVGRQNICFFKLPGEKLEVPGILSALGTWVPCIPWLPCIP